MHEFVEGMGLGNLVLSLSSIFVTALYSGKMFFSGYSSAAAFRYSGYFSSAIAADIDSGTLINVSNARIRPDAKSWTLCGRWKEESDSSFVEFSAVNVLMPHLARINAHVSMQCDSSVQNRSNQIVHHLVIVFFFLIFSQHTSYSQTFLSDCRSSMATLCEKISMPP